MLKAEQGDILRVASFRYPVVVVSKDFFNKSGLVMACPILPDTVPGPLHISCVINGKPGYVYCEQLRVVDLKARQFSRIGAVSYDKLMDLVDAIQGIFDYI